MSRNRATGLSVIVVAVACGMAAGFAVALAGKSLLAGALLVAPPTPAPTPDPHAKPRGSRRYYNTFENEIEGYTRDRAFEMKDLIGAIGRARKHAKGHSFDLVEATRWATLAEYPPLADLLRRYIGRHEPSNERWLERMLAIAADCRLVRLGDDFHLCRNGFDEARAPTFFVDFVDLRGRAENGMSRAKFEEWTSMPDLQWPKQWLIAIPISGPAARRYHSGRSTASATPAAGS